MNEKDSAILKVLSEIKNERNEEVPLSEEQEELLCVALNPTEQFYRDIENIFSKDQQINKE